MKSGGYAAFNASNRRWTLRKLAQRVNPSPFLDCLALICYPKTDNPTIDEEETVDEKMHTREDEYSEEEPLTRNEIAMTPVHEMSPRSSATVRVSTERSGEKEREIISKRAADARSSSSNEELFAKCRAQRRRNDSFEDGTS